MANKAIFLDIDGTLTEPGSNVPPESALKAVEQTRKKGNVVFLSTGRNRGMLRPLLAYPFDGYIGSAGGYIECQNKVIFDCPMSETQRTKVLSLLSECGIYRTVECLDHSFTDESFKDFLKEKCTKDGNSELLRWRRQIEESLNIQPMQEYANQPVYKVVIMSPGLTAIQKAEQQLSKEFLFCLQEPDAYGIVNGEVLNRQFDKGKGVLRVCEYLGIPIEDSIGFGDSMNDKEMMEVVGHSVCMGNGSPALKEISDEVCENVTEDGIYQAFSHLGLL